MWERELGSKTDNNFHTRRKKGKNGNENGYPCKFYDCA